MLYPGFIGNMLVGGAAAFLMWGLYGGAVAASGPAVFQVAAGALLAGVGGGRILTNEVEKLLYRESNKVLGETIQKLEEKVSALEPEVKRNPKS